MHNWKQDLKNAAQRDKDTENMSDELKEVETSEIRANICLIRVLERHNRENGRELILNKIVAKMALSG